MVRKLGAMISFTLAALSAMLVAAGAAERRWVERGGVIDAAAVRAAMEGEGAVAAGLGMRARERGDAAFTMRGGLGAWSLPLRVGPDECVAVVAGSDGRARTQRVGIQAAARAQDVIADDAMSVGFNGGGLVAHTQWCEREAADRRVVVVGESVATGSARATEHALRWAVYRGPWRAVGGPMALTRGRLRPESLDALGPELPLRAASAVIPSERRILPSVPVSFGLARLLPSDAETFGALLRASTLNENLRVNPRIDPSPVAGIAFNTGLPVNFIAVREATGVDLSPALHDPVVDLGFNDYRRVLAVVHRERLGVPCVALALVRVRLGYRPHAEALDADGTRRPLREEQNVAFDERCPARGPTVYLAPWRDHDAWSLQLLRGAPGPR